MLAKRFEERQQNAGSTGEHDLRFGDIRQLTGEVNSPPRQQTDPVPHPSVVGRRLPRLQFSPGGLESPQPGFDFLHP
jgi:hypothetical protein